MRIQTKHVINSLPLVADVLGRKYGIRVEIGGEIAATNGRTVYIPALPLDSGEDVLNMARGFIDHESGHLRYSDCEALKTSNLAPIGKFLCNLLEDYRVEKKMAAIFPGCKENLEWLCHYLHGLDKPDRTDNPALQILDWASLLITSWDMPDFRMDRDQAAHMLDWCFPGLRQQLEPVLNAAAACADTQACIDTARELARIIADYEPPEPEKPEEPEHQDKQIPEDEHSPEDKRSPEDKQSPADSQDSEIPEQAPSANNPDEADEPSTEEENTPECSTEDTGNMGGDKENSPSADSMPESCAVHADHASPETGASPAGQTMSGRESIASALESLHSLLADPDPDLPKDLGSHLRDVLEGQCRQDGERLSVAVSVPVCSQPFQPSELTAVRQATTALRTRLQALLQSTVLVRSRSARTGHVDPKRLAKLAVNDPRVFLQKGKRQGVNTAVHILLDASGSMSGMPIELACKACFAMASALNAISGVGVAVTIFQGGDGTVSPLLKHKERLHDKFFVSAHGGTPLAEAVWWVMRDMRPLTEERKIILLITDGEPDSASLVQNAIGVAQSQGFEVLGIGINTLSIQRLLPRHGCRVISALPELTPAMFGMLQDTLLQKEGGRS